MKNSLKIIIFIIVIFISLMGLGISKGLIKKESLVTSNLTLPQRQIITSTPTPPPTGGPTPSPIVLDRTSDLELETDNLTPEDFSNDFKILREETANF